MYNVSFVCDSCGVNYMIHDNMELPPLWFAAQISISNSVGFIPPQEQEVYKHFCSQKCLIEYAKSTEIRERKCMVDQLPEEEMEDFNNDGEEEEPA